MLVDGERAGPGSAPATHGAGIAARSTGPRSYTSMVPARIRPAPPRPAPPPDRTPDGRTGAPLPEESRRPRNPLSSRRRRGVIAEVVPTEVRAREAFDDAGPDGAVTLFATEQAVVEGVLDERRKEFTTVRGCARAALTALGVDPAPLVPGPLGAPGWPAGVVGSMTHCRNYRAGRCRADQGLRGSGHRRGTAGAPLLLYGGADRYGRRSGLAPAGLPLGRRSATGPSALLRQRGFLQGVLAVDGNPFRLSGLHCSTAARRHVPRSSPDA
ncbi:hypothetical protein DER30_4679 [Streptomyces sp. HB202]|nr:hypothetical protein DER30_4679 [Streptomyces sp. HB202]